MMQNPYDPPNAVVADRMPAHFSWWAVIVGMSAGTGAGFLSFYCLAPVQHLFLWSGVRYEDLYDAIGQSIGMNLVGLFLTGAASAFGGYVTANLCPARPIFHAVLAGGVSIVLSAVSYLGVFPSPWPVWSQVISFLLVIPGYICGAHYYVKTKRFTLPGKVEAED